MKIRIEGWHDGQRVCSLILEHGIDPRSALAQLGWAVQAPIDALRAPVSLVRHGPSLVGDAADELVVRLVVQPVGAEHRVVEPGRGAPTDRRLVIEPGEVAVLVQRVGAYALVCSDRGVLATEHSAATNRQGTWGLPGGGLDPGEQPPAAVMRECWEESGQHVEVGALLLVQSAHWVGRSPKGRLEDFHAVRLIYRGTCAQPTDPVVHDRVGTTAAARWVAREELAAMRWSTPAREQLTWLGVLT